MHVDIHKGREPGNEASSIHVLDISTAGGFVLHFILGIHMCSGPRTKSASLMWTAQLCAHVNS